MTRSKNFENLKKSIHELTVVGENIEAGRLSTAIHALLDRNIPVTGDGMGRFGGIATLGDRAKGMIVPWVTANERFGKELEACANAQDLALRELNSSMQMWLRAGGFESIGDAVSEFSLRYTPVADMTSIRLEFKSVDMADHFTRRSMVLFELDGQAFLNHVRDNFDQVDIPTKTLQLVSDIVYINRSNKKNCSISIAAAIKIAAGDITDLRDNAFVPIGLDLDVANSRVEDENGVEVTVIPYRANLITTYPARTGTRVGEQRWDVIDDGRISYINTWTGLITPQVPVSYGSYSRGATLFDTHNKMRVGGWSAERVEAFSKKRWFSAYSDVVLREFKTLCCELASVPVASFMDLFDDLFVGIFVSSGYLIVPSEVSGMLKQNHLKAIALAYWFYVKQPAGRLPDSWLSHKLAKASVTPLPFGPFTCFIPCSVAIVSCFKHNEAALNTLLGAFGHSAMTPTMLLTYVDSRGPTGDIPVEEHFIIGANSLPECQALGIRRLMDIPLDIRPRVLSIEGQGMIGLLVFDWQSRNATRRFKSFWTHFRLSQILRDRDMGFSNSLSGSSAMYHSGYIPILRDVLSGRGYSQFSPKS